MAVVELHSKFKIDNEVVIQSRVFTATKALEGLHLEVDTVHVRFGATTTVRTSFMVRRAELGVLEAWVGAKKKPTVIFSTPNGDNSVTLSENYVKFENQVFDGFNTTTRELHLGSSDFQKILRCLVVALKEPGSP